MNTSRRKKKRFDMRKVFILVLGMGILLMLGIRFAIPTGQPEPTPQEVSKGWTVMDSKSYAQDKLYEWQY